MKGRSGRPPDAIRAAMRGKLAAVLPKLWRDYKAGKLDDLVFATFLARYGLVAETLTVVSLDVVDRVQRRIQLIASQPRWDSAQLLERLAEVWV